MYVAITEYHDEEEMVEANKTVIILKVLEENGEESLAEIRTRWNLSRSPIF